MNVNPKYMYCLYCLVSGYEADLTRYYSLYLKNLAGHLYKV